MRDTPSRLREAAARLLADRPATRISLRDITEAAGANVASVAYHFRSKDALLEEVLRSALTDAFQRQRDQLAALPDDATLEDVIRAWVLPAFATGTEDPRQQRHRLILQHALTTPSPAVAALLAEMAGPIQQNLLQRIARHVPDVSPPELWFRHTAVLAAVGTLGAGTFTALLANLDPDTLADQLVTWIVGGLTAAPTDAPSADR